MMKQKYTALMSAALMIFLIVLISGCGSQTAQTEAATSTPSSQAAATSSSGCTSPYEGTYSGLVSGSGEVTHRKTDARGFLVDTKTPYIVTYNLEITLKCIPDGYLEVTYAKVSDTFFDCTNGCTPLPIPPNTIITILSAPGKSDGNEQLIINFPNGKRILLLSLIADPDAKTIRAEQSYPSRLLSDFGSNPDGTSYKDYIETRSCPDCTIATDKQGISMTLDRIG